MPLAMEAIKIRTQVRRGPLPGRDWLPHLRERR